MSEKQPRVYVDSCVYLDLVVREKAPHGDTGEPRWMSARSVFAAVSAGKIELACTPLVEAEVLCNGKTRLSTKEKVESTLRRYFHSPATIWGDIDRFLVEDAVEIMNQYRDKGPGPKKMKSADALHIATSIRMGCNYLLTHDGGFPISYKVDSVEVLRPQTVWQPDLWELAGEVVDSDSVVDQR